MPREVRWSLRWRFPATRRSSQSGAMPPWWSRWASPAAAFDFGAGVSVPASTIDRSIILWLSAAGTPVAATRAHGFPNELDHDAGHTLAVIDWSDAGPVTFGGDTFSGSGSAVVVWSAPAVHERSF